MKNNVAFRLAWERLLGVIGWLAVTLVAVAAGDVIPLPEHPRPDFERAAWMNLNGPWAFRFDATNTGLKAGWTDGRTEFPLTVMVPFPWGSPLSQVPDEAPVAWYARTVRAPEAWRGQRVFLVIGACDWETQAWLDGQPLGTHRGGYTPFEFELTPHLSAGKDHRLVLRVDDTAREFARRQQGYGNARASGRRSISKRVQRRISPRSTSSRTWTGAG